MCGGKKSQPKNQFRDRLQIQHQRKNQQRQKWWKNRKPQQQLAFKRYRI